MTKAIPRINLHKLILLLTLFFVSITFVSVLFASYHEQRQLFIKRTLSSNLFYATMLAETTDNIIDTLQYQMQLRSQALSEHIHDPRYLQDSLTDMHKIARRLNAIQIVNDKGSVLATSSHEEALPTHYETDEASMEIRHQQIPFVTTSYIESLHHQVINITEPLFDQNHRYLGYLNAMIFLQKDNILFAILNNNSYNNGADIYLIDSQRHILNHSDDTKLGLVMNDSAVTDALSDQHKGMIEFYDEDRQVLAGYAPIKRLQWGVIVQRPISTPLSLLFPLILSTAAKTFPLLLISLFGIWYLSKQIASPLWKLATQARNMDDPESTQAVEKIHAWYFEAEQLKDAMLQGLKQVDTKIDRLSRESLTDQLTGLVNRRGIDKKLTEWGHITYTVLFMDIDHFKNVNDTYGHEAGDMTLQTLAAQMRLNFRPNDLLCRFGGEEFLIYLPFTPLDEGYQIAERFRKIIENYPFREVKHITISIGIATNTNMTTTSVEDMVKSADEAMYQAKSEGRNRTVKIDSIEHNTV